VEDILAGVPVRRFEAMSEHGFVALPQARPPRERDPGELRCVYVGRLIRSKGARDAIRALAQLGDLPNVTLDIVGDGEDRRSCEAEVEQFGLRERVRFHGWLTKPEVAQRYLESDALVFPSFREPSGRVVLEAMSYGLPVVAAAYGGPGAMIDAEVGVAVPCVEPAQYVRDIARALRDLAGNPSGAAHLGAAGRRLIELRYMWPSKIDWLERLYAEVLTS
jgi:glycosyltransferase involved in cell wall biosynthesis